MTKSLGQTVLYPGLTPVRVVALANISGSYNNGPANNGVGATLIVAASSLTIDSVVLELSDRVLLQNQTTSYENGIYIVKEISTVVVLQRAEDQQSIEQLKIGQFVTVGAGTINAAAAFVLVAPLPQHIGVDDLLWVSSPLSAALGTAGSKAASDNALPTVASTAGSGFTPGNLVMSSDAAGTIEDAGIAPGDVFTNALDDGDIWVGNAMNVATGVTPSGDITLSNAGVFGIASGVIVDGDINSSAAIAFSKLAALVSGNILVGSAGGEPTSVAVTGDVFISNTGVTTIQPAAVDLTMLDTAISPSHVVKFAGVHECIVDATQVITVTGAAATDLAFAQFSVNGEPRDIVTVAVTTNTVTVVLDGAAQVTDRLIYQVLRATV